MSRIGVPSMEMTPPVRSRKFVYIAAADLLPEIARETRTRAKLGTSIAFVAGLGLLLAATQISS
jgi:hypothetical protein